MQTSQNAPCVIIFCILDLTRKEGIYLHYECDDEVSQKTTFDECKGYWRLITIYIRKEVLVPTDLTFENILRNMIR